MSLFKNIATDVNQSINDTEVVKQDVLRRRESMNQKCQNELEVAKRVQEIEVREKSLDQIEQKLSKFKNYVKKQKRIKNSMARRKWLLNTWKY